MVIPRWSVLRPPPRKAAAALMALALALSGCGGTNPDPGRLRGRVVLLVGLTQDDSFNAATRDVLTAHLDEVDRSFRAIHPGVSLQVQVFPEEEVVQEVRRRHRSGLGPDLLYVNGSTARQLCQAGLTRPVPLAPAVIEPLHPDAVRLMLTGHADMQTAIDAINQGSIYRFLTKPWDDTELKVTLFLAFEQLELERENRRLLAMVRRQYDVMKGLEKEHPGLAHVVRDAEGYITLDDDDQAGRMEVRLSAVS